MALTHLLDTSVLTRLNHATVRSAVEPPASAGRAARAGISDRKIGFSARNATEWDQLTSALTVSNLVETTARHMQRARTLQRQLASTSQRGRKIPDLLVAAAAEEAGLTVLHCDTEFDIISAVTGPACAWVTPPGTIS